MSLRLEDMSWRCDICRRERPDANISVHKVDIGPAGLPAGTVIRNVKYCNDNPNCYDAALNWKEDEQRRRITFMSYREENGQGKGVGMTEAMKLQTSHREIHAKTFALDKARDVHGTIVQMVLDRTVRSGVAAHADIEEAERMIERFVAAVIKNSVMEFTDIYLADLERRLEAMQRLHEGAMNAVAEGLV